MSEWQDLIAGFRRINDPFSSMRAEWIKRLGEDKKWEIASYQDSLARKTFEALARRGGILLVTSLEAAGLCSAEVRSQADDLARWLDAVAELTQHIGTSAFFATEEGTTTLRGSVDRILERSVLVCRQLEAEEEKLKLSAGRIGDMITKEIGETLKKEETPIVPAGYVFINEGPSWLITYEGKTTKSLLGKGFAVLHLLARNPYKHYTVEDLDKEFGYTKIGEAKRSKSAGSGNSQDEARFKAGGGDRYTIMDQKTKMACKKRIQQLEEDLLEAERDEDPDRMVEIREEIRQLKDQLSKAVTPFGTLRAFRDEKTRSIDTYATRIRRALNQLKKHDEKAWKHFHDALKPIKSPSFCYRPSQEITWRTE